MIKRFWMAATAAAALALTGLVALPAQATENDSPPNGECVPQDARTEEIEHPAEGEEFIEVIDTEAWTEEIEHPAVYEDVEHEAVYAVDREYRKQVRGDVWQRDNGKNKAWHKTDQKFDWTWWEPASIQWSEQDVEVLQSGPHNGVVKEWTQGNGNKRWRWVSTEYRYVQTGETRQGRMLKEPWTESVLVKDAWTETIEHEATYKTVENPDYVPAWIETIEHPAVECPPEIPEQPGPDNFTDRGEFMTCDGLFTWAELYEWDYSWNAEKQEWVPNEPVLIERVETKVRDLTREEQIEEGCIMLPPPPTETPEPPSGPDPEETEEPDPEETEEPDPEETDPPKKRDRERTPEPEEELAETGIDMRGLGIIALLGALAGTILIGTRKKFMPES